MAKKLIKRFLPNPKKIEDNKYLKIFGKFIYDQNLWQLNRYSVATAFSVGLFLTYLPFPGHMIYAALLAILLRANLPISLALVWVVNPLTMIPMYGFAYTLGAKLLGAPITKPTLESFLVFNEIWGPFILGCLICGSFLALAGNIGIRIYWRYSVARAWKLRAEKIEARKPKLNPVL